MVSERHTPLTDKYGQMERLFSCGVFIDLKKAVIVLIILPYRINLNTLAFVA